MAFITPTNNVMLLTGVPINNDYENTLYFSSRTDQYNYFSSKVKVVDTGQSAVTMAFTDVSYQRYQRNCLKLEVTADYVYDCNYMMFQNTNFGTKWFYAFITDIEYIANTVTMIRYEIDYIQTWLLDCTLKPSFVVRKHYATDSRYTSRVPENLDTGEYMTEKIDYVDSFTASVYVMAVTKLPALQQQYQTAYQYFRRTKGSGNGLYYLCFPIDADGLFGLNRVIGYYTSTAHSLSFEDIIMIFEAPKICFVDDQGSEPAQSLVSIDTVFSGIPVDSEHAGKMWSLKVPTALNISEDVASFDRTVSFNNSLGTYTPRNKKLLQYPYNFLYVYDGKGNNATYRYEDFDWWTDGEGITPPVNCEFKYYYAGNADTALMIVPYNYRIKVGGGGNPPVQQKLENRNESMVFKGFPQCSWNNDTYKAWFAQNGGVVGSVIRMVGGGIGMVEGDEVVRERERGYDVSEFSGASPQYDVLGASMRKDGRIEARYGYNDVSLNPSKLSNVLNSTARELSSLRQHSKMPMQVCGNFNSDLPYQSGVHSFQFTRMYIRPQYADRIDRFFDMYGYACNSVETPSYNNRYHWSYIQTRGLNMIASIPQEAEEKIRAIFENGIRFWNTPSIVGEYVAYASQNVAGWTPPVTP